jgi:hypothetical protein
LAGSWACALAVSLAVSFGAAERPRQPHPVETIVQDDAVMLHRPREVRTWVERMRTLGVDSVRITAGWSALAPRPGQRQRPAFHATDSRDYPKAGFEQLDRAIRESVRGGLKPMLDLAFFAPRWGVQRGSPRDGRHRWRPRVREYRQFVEAVARRYDGTFRDPEDASRKLPSVRVWTTWNEPNHPTFLLPQWKRVKGKWEPEAPHVYRAMHDAAYDVLKRVDASNQVLVGGLAGRGDAGKGVTKGLTPLRFVRELACVDARGRPLKRRECRKFRPVRADGFAIHPYTFTGPPTTSNGDPDNVVLADVGRLTSLLDQLAVQRRLAKPLPVWITEYGYETNPPDPRGGASLDQQAQWLSQSAFLSWRNKRVHSFAQFLLRDIGPDLNRAATDPRRWEDYQTGLYDYDGNPKPAARAFALPFWIERALGPGDTPGAFVFGQVRRGGVPAEVVLQRLGSTRWEPVPSLPAGVGGYRESCRSFTADTAGFYARFVPWARPGLYRALARPSGSRTFDASQPVVLPVVPRGAPPAPAMLSLMRPSG